MTNDSVTPATVEPSAERRFAEARGSAALSDKELASEIIQCLRVNMLRGTMTTENDEQFWAFINAWGQGKSAVGIKPPNVRTERPAEHAGSSQPKESNVL